MQISYIPPVVTTKNPIEQAIENALLSTIVKPFKSWLFTTTSKLVVLGEWVLTIGCATGIIMAMFNIDDGKKLAKKCVVIFIALELVKVVVF